MPKEWQTRIVVPLFKKGDQRVCANYRGITLLSLPGKVYSKVLERRVRPLVEPQIEEVQCGFHPGHGTTTSLTWKGPGNLLNQSTCALCNWRRLLGRYCGRCRGSIQSLNAQSKSCVQVLCSKSHLCLVGVCLRQGCALSPILFTIFKDKIWRGRKVEFWWAEDLVAAFCR